MALVTDAVQMLSVTHTRGPDGERYMTRLTAPGAEHDEIPGGAGASGFAVVDLDDDVAVAVDPADPSRILEVLVGRPEDGAVATTVGRILGEDARAALRGDAERLVDVDPATVGAREAVGRLALLGFVREGHPAQLDALAWLVEEAHIAIRLAHTGVEGPWDRVAPQLLGSLERLRRRVPTSLALNDLRRALDRPADPPRLVPALDAVLTDLASTTSPPVPIPPLPVPPPAALVSSVPWSQVPRGLVDPREGAVTITSSSGRLAVRVEPAPRALRPAGQLWARILDGDDRLVAQVELRRSGPAFQGDVVLDPAGLDAGWDVDVTGDPARRWKPRRVRAVDRAHREAFRAMANERRSVAEGRAATPGAAVAEASRLLEAARRWVAAKDAWVSAGHHREADDARLRAAGAARAAGAGKDRVGQKLRAAGLGEPPGPGMPPGPFVAELATDPRQLEGAVGPFDADAVVDAAFA